MIVYDDKGVEHNKQSIDAHECVEALGWTFEKVEVVKPKRKPKAKVKVVEAKEVDIKDEASVKDGE